MDHRLLIPIKKEGVYFEDKIDMKMKIQNENI